MSYANLVPVIKFLSRFNNSGIPKPNPSQQLQQAFNLVWWSGAHHSRWGVLSQPYVIPPPPIGVCGKYSLTSFYGQLDHFGALWPLGNITSHWPLMASGHVLNSLAFLANSPPHQPPGQYLFLVLGVPSGPSSQHLGLWPNTFDYGF
ncbi:hypothetical protein O181_055962 [Austropuccinia psidii MF-1]|uniref:Uncharacterized protein n=1 Tax=Austropuccinia psidii MF-1 TaxID=1389203 RepID=A0A9Q3E9W9_9BASI|nr:hypothetical protein [Austropuccinia psidii MF-1]